MRNYLDNIKDSINHLDPDRIYVENIRAILGSNTFLATLVCEIAVQAGFFKKHYSIECKNRDCGRVIFSCEDVKNIPSKINCVICEDDDREFFEWDSSILRKIPYYSYVRGSWDEWWFWNCTNIPDDLPDYITKLNLDPKDWSDFVDCGFSFEEATKIISKKCPEN
jgi:hypothetical protein